MAAVVWKLSLSPTVSPSVCQTRFPTFAIFEIKLKTTVGPHADFTDVAAGMKYFTVRYSEV